MDAIVKATVGSIRVFNFNPQPDQGELLPDSTDYAAPSEIEVSGDWAVGQVPIEDNGVFVVAALVDGNLRVYSEYKDEHGNVAPSNDSEVIEMKAGEEREFTTTNSNALKVSTKF